MVARTLSAQRPLTGSDGRVHLAYEVRLSNMTSQSATINGLDVVDQDGDVVERVTDEQISSWVRVSGNPEGGTTLDPARACAVARCEGGTRQRAREHEPCGRRAPCGSP